MQIRRIRAAVRIDLAASALPHPCYLRSGEYTVMGLQILKWSHPPLKSILPNPFSVGVSLEAEGTIRPVCGTRGVPSLLNKLNRAAVALCLVTTLLVALTVCTGILIAALKYAANRANQTFYEMLYRRTGPSIRS